jgi:hypothetical protein
MVGDDGGSFCLDFGCYGTFFSFFLHSNDIPKICEFMLDKTRI